MQACQNEEVNIHIILYCLTTSLLYSIAGKFQRLKFLNFSLNKNFCDLTFKVMCLDVCYCIALNFRGRKLL